MKEKKDDTNYLIVIKGSIFHKFHELDTELASKYGIEKSLIIRNLNKFDSRFNATLHEAFPYIEEEEFYKLLNELFKEGILTHEK